MNTCVDQLVAKFNVVFEQSKPHDRDYDRSWKTDIENVNKAAMLFSKSVVKNRDRIVDKMRFRSVLRVYLNILFIPEIGEKREITSKKALCDLSWLDNDTMDDIIHMSKPGRYLSVQRTLPRITNSLYEHREEFLDIVDAFVAGGPYVELWKKVAIFVHEVQPGNPATFTGILAALKPRHFMVYNERSVAPLYDTECSHLTKLKMDRYLDFNCIYRKVAIYMSKSLVDLDIASVKLDSARRSTGDYPT